MTLYELIVALLKIMYTSGGTHLIYVDPQRNSSGPSPRLEVSKGGLDPYRKGVTYVSL